MLPMLTERPGALDFASEKVLPKVLFVGSAILLGFFLCILGGLPLMWTLLGGAALTFVAIFVIAPDKKMLLWGFYLVLLPLSAAKWFIHKPYFFFGGSPKALVIFLSDLPIFALFVMWLAEVGIKKKQIHFPRTHLPIILGLVWSGISLLKAMDIELGIYDLIKMTKYYLLYLLVANQLDNRKWINATVGLLLFDLAVQVVLNILSYIYHGQFTVWGLRKYEYQLVGGEEVFRATGSMGPHNVQAHYYEMMLPLAMVLIFSFRRLALRAIGTILLAAGVFSLTVTFSRGGWAAGGLGFLLVALFLLGRRHISMTTISVITLAGVIALAAFLLGPENVVQRRITYSPREATLSRWEMIKVGLRIIVANPILGVGQNNSVAVLKNYFGEEGPPKEVWWPVENTRLIIPIHNKYLFCAAENGLPGLAFFLWFLVAWLQEGWMCLKARDDWVVALATWLIAACVGVSVHNSISEFAYSSVIEHFYLLAGILGGLAFTAKKEGLLPVPKAR